MIILVSGLFRLSASKTTALYNLAISPSLIFEIFGFSLLVFWLPRARTTGFPPIKHLIKQVAS